MIFWRGLAHAKCSTTNPAVLISVRAHHPSDNPFRHILFTSNCIPDAGSEASSASTDCASPFGSNVLRRRRMIGDSNSPALDILQLDYIASYNMDPILLHESRSSPRSRSLPTQLTPLLRVKSMSNCGPTQCAFPPYDVGLVWRTYAYA